ncbi:MAG: 3'-5' exonuclease, partial [Gemmatimonadales bacterium]
IRALLDGGRVADPNAPDGQRSVRSADIAVLARKRRSLDRVGEALHDAGIAVYNAASLGLSERQEVLDLVTALRLLADPRDDYHAFAFLRSPFVGLRDEVITRFRLDPAQPGGPLQRQAAAWLRRVESGEASWFPAAEHPFVADAEREALRRALATLEEGQALVDRVDASELLEDLVRRTGYRLHLLLRPNPEEALAAIERFLALLDEYRDLSLGSFLDLWDRWGEQDLGIPQAPLYSAADDVVTLQTIHTAKGLEWPIVFLVGAADPEWDRLGDGYLTDPELGPVLMPSKSDRGPRARRIAARALAAEHAEEARLLYVALTRARDRLVVSAPDVEKGYMTFMAPMLREATLPHLVPEEPARPPRRAARARAEDPITRTGSQIEVFPDDGGQLDIFRHATPAGEGERNGDELPLRPVVHRSPDPEQAVIQRIPVALDWAEGLVSADLPELARDIEAARERALTSATERQLRETDPRAWRLRYVHGVEEAWRFAPRAGGEDEIPATLRGTLIHGVLERIEAVEELSRLLGETIADVDAPPGVEEMLEPGAPYRRALEAEIERVVRGERWRWYVEGPHYRELPFLVLAGGRPWVTGALDLYRPGSEPWIIDFKTHRISPDEAPRTAADYEIQARVYRDAVSALSGRTPRVLLHFTHPDVAVEMEG